MKILVVGDLHIKKNNINERIKLLQWIESLSKKVDLTVYLGDIFHDHNIVHCNIHNLFSQHLYNLQSEGIIIEGNHDLWHPKDNTHSSLRSLKTPSYVDVISKPTNKYDLSFVPFCPDIKSFPKIGLCKIVFTHNEFKGAVTPYYKFEEGLEVEDFSCDLIMSGHIHMGQRLGKVLYIGTPVADGVDDANQDKGVYILNTEDGKLDFIESPFPKVFLHKVKAFEFNDFVIPKDGHKHIVEIIGTKEEIASATKSEKTGISIKTKIIDNNISCNGSNSKEILENYVKEKYKDRSPEIINIIKKYLKY